MTTTEILTGVKNWVSSKLSLKQDVINDLAAIRSGSQAGSTAVQPSDLSSYFNNASYDTNTHRINFYHGQNIVAYVDASPFIVDGMVNDVRIENGYLVIDFNTDSGKQDISIPLTDIFNPNNYYTKGETDLKFTQKQSEIDDLYARIGYYVCSTEGNVAAKTIVANDYTLGNGGSIKVKMTNANTADNATLNINSTGAKALYYAGERASANNSWEAGETVEVYYDGTSYYANNVTGGSGSGDGAFDVSVKYPTSGVDGGNTYTLDGALAVLNANLSANKKKGGMSIKFIQSSDNKYVQYRLMSDTFNTTIANWQGVDDVPTAGSNNLVKSDSLSRNPYFHSIQQGSLSTTNGTETPSNVRIRTSFIEAIPYTKVTVPTGFEIVRVFYYSKNLSFGNAVVINASNLIIPTKEDLTYFRLVISKTDATQTIIPTEVSISISNSITEELSNVQKKSEDYSLSRLDSAVGIYDYTEHEGYLQTNGTYDGTTTSHCLVSGKFSCKAGDVFLYKGRGELGGVSALFYNNDTIIGSYQVYSTEEYAEITIPANTNYVVFSSFNGLANDVVLSVFLKSKVIQRVLSLENAILKEPTINLFNPNVREVGYLTNKGKLDGGAPYYTTDYLPIEQGTKYYITAFRKLAFYNTSRVHQSAYYVDGAENYVFTAPINGFIRFSYATTADYYSTLMYGVGETIPEYYIPYGKKIQEGVYASETIINEVIGRSNQQQAKKYGSVLYGKKYVACGDSFTQGDFSGRVDESLYKFQEGDYVGQNMVYPFYIGRRCGMNVVNEAISGSVMALTTAYLNGQQPITYRSPFSYQRYKNIPADADYITLWFGINDAGTTNLGTLTDTTNETFYGAWNVVLPYLILNHPYAKIGIVITDRCSNEAYTQAVREVATKWGIPYLDLPGSPQVPAILERDTALNYSDDAFNLRRMRFYNMCMIKCTTANSDASFTPANWSNMFWEGGESFSVGDYTQYENIPYKCTTANSDSTFTPSKWKRMVWSPNETVLEGELWVVNGEIYRALTNHTDATYVEAHWQSESWTKNTSYSLGAVTVYRNGHPNPECHEYQSTFIENWLKSL